MTIGSPWNITPSSDAKLNYMETISGTGAELAALNKSEHTLLRCTSTGSGFTLDHVYLCLADGTDVIDLTLIEDHRHSYSSDGDGGAYIDILKANPETLDLYLSRPTDIIKANWNQTVTGTGSIEDGGGGASKPYIRLRPNATSGSGATISYTNAISMSFANPSRFVATGNFETATNLAFHAGVNCDDVTAADSNTAKVQAEVCTVTNQNWFIRTADGSANSASDIGVAIGTSDTSISIKHDPNGTPDVDIEIDAANEFNKTTNIPITGSNTTGNILKFSIKNSTAADRPYRFKGCRLSYITGGSWGYG